MPLVRVGVLGTPRAHTCPRCFSGYAWRRPVLTLTDSAVEVGPFELVTCRECGLLAKQRTD